MSANMLFFASRSRSPIRLFALRAGFTSASKTARASAPVTRLGATPTAASAFAEDDFFPVSRGSASAGKVAESVESESVESESVASASASARMSAVRRTSAAGRPRSSLLAASLRSRPV